MKRTIYRLVTGVLWAGWMLAVFLFSSQPAGESGKLSGTVAYRVVEACDTVFRIGLTEKDMERYAANIDYPVRKAAHMTEYAVFGLLSFALFVGYRKCGRGTYLAALFTAAAYAMTDELHQLFVPGRSGRLSDVCIDTAGAAVGLFFLFILLKLLARHCEKKRHPLQ